MCVGKKGGQKGLTRPNPGGIAREGGAKPGEANSKKKKTGSRKGDAKKKPPKGKNSEVRSFETTTRLRSRGKRETSKKGDAKKKGRH